MAFPDVRAFSRTSATVAVRRVGLNWIIPNPELRRDTPPPLARIFSVLAVIALVLLAANFAVGLWVGDFGAAAAAKQSAGKRLADAQRSLRASREQTSADYEQARRDYAAADQRFRTPRSRMTIHLLLGCAAALVAILVNSITITYFIGTSRWCKEVCATYKIDAELAAHSTQLKRSTFPWALAGVLTVIVLIGLGAAADASGANSARSAAWVTPHYIAAMLGIVIIAISFVVQITRIAENYAVIEQILLEVKRIREGRSK